ncbi:MAG: ATP-dependent metallopeptidase FtsH/Yme1/Tma family protein [Planctomycetes bacterium]|nr:ATP-dependent metallopeptidase FtsH/Yme1/Tma family protein [Planctomycetota bacterium]
MRERFQKVFKEPLRFSLWYIIIAVIALTVVQNYFLAPKIKDITYSEFKANVREGKVIECRVMQGEGMITGKLREDGNEVKFITAMVYDPDLVKELDAKGVKYAGQYGDTWLKNFILAWVLPMGLLILVWWLLFRRMGPARTAMSFGRSRGKLYAQEDMKIRFEDVAGIEEAKEELKEIVEFLKTPEKFRRLGGKIPKGVLLVGAPGTGKTLLAKAVAGEAGVPFFSMSGSDFVEMFVGVGAARVRDLFEQANEKAPCIIFIDELDALGKTRGINPIGGHDEREQTLNQLLVEMDGFDTNKGVIIMGATNRPETLDSALLRPGRFDRHVVVDIPDINGREAILKVHTKDVKLAPGLDLRTVAAMTPGFVGADLANLVNEAALRAARRDKTAVDKDDFAEAVDRIVAGLEKKKRLLNKREKEIVAHHESGHALVACSLPNADPVRKISMIPRGAAALGYTLQLPTEDRYLMTRSELLDRVCIMLGGRLSEQLMFNEVSTGAQNDLERATDVARRMVKDYGMSESLGLVTFENGPRSPFMPPTLSFERHYSEHTAREIDLEVKKILDEAAAKARDILSRKKETLQRIAQTLMEKEVIEGEELKQLLGCDVHHRQEAGCELRAGETPS